MRPVPLIVEIYIMMKLKLNCFVRNFTTDCHFKQVWKTFGGERRGPVQAEGITTGGTSKMQRRRRGAPLLQPVIISMNSARNWLRTLINWWSILIRSAVRNCWIINSQNIEVVHKLTSMYYHQSRRCPSSRSRSRRWCRRAPGRSAWRPARGGFPLIWGRLVVIFWEADILVQGRAKKFLHVWIFPPSFCPLT